MSCRRSLGEIAVLMLSRATCWSSGVGCSRKREVDRRSGAHAADRRQQREQSQRERRVGRDRDAPALGGRAPEVEQREHEAPALAKVAEVELAPRLETQ